MSASAIEQLQLELINEARLDPEASFARYITSFSPLTANQSNIQQNFDFWHVNGAALQSAINALQPVQPLAWNDSLGNAARTYSVNMGVANAQVHTSLNGEAAGTADPNDDPGARMQANGYGSFTAWGENIAAKSDDSIEILASLMVDWGSGANGMQSPPGHRDNIMGIDEGTPNIQSAFREIGVGIANVTPQSNVGPLAVTEDFATHGSSGAFILGVAYNDTDNNKFYSVGEGLGTLAISAVGGASTTSAASGGYSLFTTQVGAQHITFTGAGLSSAVDFATTLSNGENIKIDIVNGTTLRTSVSGAITGPVSRIEGLGIVGLTLTADSGSQTIVDTKGNDTIDGGGGTDTVVFAGARSAYTLTDLGAGSVKVVGPDGTDTLSNVERLQFDDQTVTWPPGGPGSVSINDATIVEGNSGTQLLNFTVTRTGGTTSFSVNFATMDGTATVADGDYLANSGTLNFGANVNTQPVQITINGDTKLEPNETFFVNLSTATNGAAISDGQGQGTITNDEQVAGSVSINDATIVEGNSGTQLLNFTVTRTGGTAAFSVNFATSDGTATVADGDYLANSGTLNFGTNVNTQPVQITINGDTKLEPNETFFVNLSTATNGAAISDSQGQGTITNDELIAGSVSINDATIVEGNSGTQLLNFTVTRTGGTAAFSINYATMDGTASIADGDYLANSGTLNFGANVNTQPVQITINGDIRAEANENLFINLSSATNGATISDNQGTGTITNDDGAFVNVDGSANGALVNLGDHVLFGVQLIGGHDYVLNELGVDSGGGTLADPLLRLIDLGSVVLGSDDDSGTGRDAQLAIHVSTTGYFHLDAGAFNDASVGTFTVGVQDLGTAAGRFHASTYEGAMFGASLNAGGWSSDNTYPRELADVNGDGRADIVGFGAGGAYVSLSTGGGHFAASTYEGAMFGTSSGAGGWASDSTYPRELADVNGDGRADIVGFGIGGAYVSLATGAGHFAAPTYEGAIFGTSSAAGGWASDNTYPRELGDVNGDGKADIVGFGIGGVYVSLATGAGHFAAPTYEGAMFGSDTSAGGWSSNDTYPRALGDVNGDGRADIVGFGAGGIYVSLATSNGHFALPTYEGAMFGTSTGAGGWSSDNTYPRELADVNGDGKADIVGFGLSGVYVSLATGNGHFAASTFEGAVFGTSAGAGGWASDNTYPRQLGEETGDGRVDIVGFGEGGVYISPSHDFLLV